MIITKLFNVESAHIVRNCTSHRCSHSIHGHSAKIELSLESNQLDNAGMVYDFGLMKGTIKELIDSGFKDDENDPLRNKHFIDEETFTPTKHSFILNKHCLCAIINNYTIFSGYT